MRIGLFLITALLLAGCARNPCNNPFDGRYNFSIENLQSYRDFKWVEDSTDISRLNKHFGSYSVDLIYDAHTLGCTGKQFTFHLDTLALPLKPEEIASPSGFTLMDSISNATWKAADLRETLESMKCTLDSIRGPRIYVRTHKPEQTVVLRRMTNFEIEGDAVLATRDLSVYLPKKQFKRGGDGNGQAGLTVLTVAIIVLITLGNANS